MSVQRTRFGVAYPPHIVAALEEQAMRVEIFQPTHGFDQGRVAENLSPGFSPDCESVVREDGYMLLREGLVSFGGSNDVVDTGLGGPALGMWQLPDIVGAQWALVVGGASGDQIAVFDPALDTWRLLSASAVAPTGTAPTATLETLWDAAAIYDVSLDENIAVLTNGLDVPKVVELSSGVAAYSDLQNFSSVATNAASVCNHDNRLVFFAINTSTNRYPQRVMWTPKGEPQNFTLADGYGFQDLIDMAGVGQKVLADADGIVLFSDEQIWRGRPRNDNYVYDFYPIERQMGCPFPRTITRTPYGIVFLGRDFELYLLSGDRISPLGPSGANEPSRIQTFLAATIYEPDRAWAAYNPREKRYELNYPGSDSAEGFASRGLWYNLAEKSFWPQRFEVELSAGCQYVDPGTSGGSFDQSVESWDYIAATWENITQPGVDYRIHAISTSGISLRFHPDAVDDYGTAYSGYWTSHAMNRADQMRYDTLNELFLDYSTESDSSVTVEFLEHEEATPSTSTSLTLTRHHRGRSLATGSATGVSPQFRVRFTSGARPKLSRFQARLVEAGLYPG